MYVSKCRYGRNAIPTKVVGGVRWSKNNCYETPYIVKGNIQQPGAKE